MIVDTDFVIDVMNDDDAAVARAVRMDDEGVVQRVPAAVAFELFVGVGYGEQPDAEVRKIQAVLESKPFVPVDGAISRKAGRVKGRLLAAGEDVGIGDTMVAATGVLLDEPVLTRNVEEFNRFPDWPSRRTEWCITPPPPARTPRRTRGRRRRPPGRRRWRRRRRPAARRRTARRRRRRPGW